MSRRTPRSARRPVRISSHASDAEVVAVSLECPDAFEVIFERYHATIWRFLARVAGARNADDLAGDVFVAAFTNRAQYEPTRGSVRSWIYGVASNLAKSRLRSEARGIRAHERFARRAERFDDPISDLDDEWILRQRVADVSRAFAMLTASDREILVMYACDDLTYEEIAAACDVALGTVKSRLARARQHLRELLPLNGEHFMDPLSALDTLD